MIRKIVFWLSGGLVPQRVQRRGVINRLLAAMTTGHELTASADRPNQAQALGVAITSSNRTTRSSLAVM